MDANNCKYPPHFPPHCGCPAGSFWSRLRALLAGVTR